MPLVVAAFFVSGFFHRRPCYLVGGFLSVFVATALFGIRVFFIRAVKSLFVDILSVLRKNIPHALGQFVN